MKDTKLKDYKYMIAGTDSPKPLNDCLDAIFMGLYIAQILFFGTLAVIKYLL